jgi:hypothetical protein
MSNIPEYICSSCKRPKKRSELTVKKAVFLEMGAGARTRRSRVVAWLCGGCLVQDEQYCQPAFTPPRQVQHG